MRHLGRFTEALLHNAIAAALAPRSAEAACEAGQTLAAAGQIRCAAKLFQRAFEIDPTSVEARAALARPEIAASLVDDDPAAMVNCEAAAAAASLGKAEEAQVLYEAFLTDNPNAVPAWTDYGRLLLAMGRPADAVNALRRALKVRPEFAPALNNLAAALAARGEAEELLRTVLMAVTLEPGMRPAWRNVCEALRAHGRFTDALDAQGVVMALDGDDAKAYADYADQARALRRFDLAIHAMDRLEARRPNDFMVWNNRGAYRLDAGDWAGAEHDFHRATELWPQSPLAWSNLGAARELQGRYGPARDAYERGLNLAPEDPQVLMRLIHASQHSCDWDRIEVLFARAGDAARAGRLSKVPPFSLLAVPGVTAADMLAAGQSFAKDAAAGAGAPLRPQLTRHGGRLRVGYASSDLYGHATAWLLAEVLEQHDREAVEVFVYSYGETAEDETRARVRAASEHFIDINALSDVDAAARIAADELDILIDLKGYTRGSRPGIFARRPAPVQMNYLGFPGTLGADFIDYIIADPVVIPPELERYYAEGVLRMPHCYQPNDRKRPLPPPPSRESVGLPENAVVLCNFNSPYKVTPDVFALWMRVMREVPDTVLWSLSAGVAADLRLREQAELRGVEGDRLVFAGRAGIAEHLARFQLADVFFDTFPCTGHTTASDALWAGVPVVTRMGDTFTSRVAGSLVAAVGLPELAASSARGYYSVARALAKDRAMQAKLKAHLNAVRLTCPLFDSTAYARGLEDLFREAVAKGPRSAAQRQELAS
jgi:protein O-GlcNAc transferase